MARIYDDERAARARMAARLRHIRQLLYGQCGTVENYHAITRQCAATENVYEMAALWAMRHRGDPAAVKLCRHFETDNGGQANEG